jgi:exosortase/archaeosortase family protein
VTAIPFAIRRATRCSSGAALALAGVWVLANTATYREAEAWSIAKVVSATADQGTHLQPHSATFFVGLNTNHGVGLRIDQLCSTGPIAGLVLIITGLLMTFAGVRVHRSILGAGLMIGIVTLVNGLRLTALAWTAATWGLSGWFEWLHLYGGAALTMFAIIGGCALYLRLLRRPTHTAAH